MGGIIGTGGISYFGKGFAGTVLTGMLDGWLSGATARGVTNLQNDKSFLEGYSLQTALTDATVGGLTSGFFYWVSTRGFNIRDWTGYPDQIAPRPEGSIKLLEGDEYEAAREAANRANAKLHRQNPSLEGLEIHEIKPVKFGGSPTDPLNKIYLTPEDHAQLTNWWRALQKLLTGK